MHCESTHFVVAVTNQTKQHPLFWLVAATAHSVETKWGQMRWDKWCERSFIVCTQQLKSSCVCEVMDNIKGCSHFVEIRATGIYVCGGQTYHIFLYTTQAIAIWVRWCPLFEYYFVRFLKTLQVTLVMVRGVGTPWPSWHTPAHLVWVAIKIRYRRQLMVQMVQCPGGMRGWVGVGVCVCAACDCDGIGSLGRSCDVTSGQCRCRPNYGGRSCAQCAPGYYNYPACQRTYTTLHYTLTHIAFHCISSRCFH